MELEDGVVRITRGCGQCLWGACKKVGPKGNPAAEFVVVGESPGSQEILQGKPFVGPSGQIVDLNLPPDIDIYYTNALQCMPKGDKQSTLPKAVECCRERLIEEIAKYPRKVILALGNGALWALTGDYNHKITQARGMLYESDLAERGIIAAVHPAFLLRGGGSYKKFQEDLNYAVSLYYGGPVRKPIIPEYQVYRTPEEVQQFVDLFLSEQPEASVGDIETSGFIPTYDEILSIGFCWDPHKVHIIRGLDEKMLTEWVKRKRQGVDTLVEENIGVKKILARGCEQLKLLKPVLEHSGVNWIWHNGKFDVRFLRTRDIQPLLSEDTMLMNYSLDETRGIHGLDDVASDVLGADNWKDEFQKHLPRQGASYAHAPEGVLDEYLARDCSNTFQIRNILKPRVEKDRHAKKLYEETLLPAALFLLEVEYAGFTVDWDVWSKNKEDLEARIEDLRHQMGELAGYAINPNSPKQMVKFLFEELGLKSKKKSTAAEVIEKLPRVPAVIILEEYRKKTKEYNTYVKGLKKNIHDDGKVHPDFMLHGTVTGRLACKDPNMQNIPRSPLMRGMFRAAPGCILINADYSQAELRSLATLSGDEELIKIYAEKRSLHKEMAVFLFGENYDKEQYVRTKAVNFGIVYGREAFTLAEEFSIPVSEAQAMIDGWFKRFPVAHTFIKRCRAAPAKGQTLVTKFGRRKRPGLVSKDILKSKQNEFANFPHQATASDCTLHAAMRSLPEIKPLGARIVNLVHDSIIVDCPDELDTVHKVMRIMKHHMESVPVDFGLNKVPFEAEFDVCYNWDNPIPENKMGDYMISID